jgi:catecholate siderophore receptor
MSTARRLACLSLAAFPAGFAACPAHANAEAEAEAPIVVTAELAGETEVSGTRTATALIDTPQSVTVLERERIDEQGVESLGEALRYVPGVTLGQGEGHRDQVVLRGQASTADFFVDGLRDDAQYYRPLYNTQQVEVLKGPNALLFGRGGGGGVINRVSKLPRPGRTGLAAAAGFDSFGAWSLAGDANLALGGSAALRLNATYEDLANSRDGFGGHFVGIAPTIALEPDAGTRLMLAYEYNSDSRVIDRGIPSRSGQPIAGYDATFFGSTAVNHGTVEAHVARIRLDQELGNGLTLAITGQYGFYDKYYANLLPGATTASTVSFSGYDSAVRRGNWIGQASLVWHGRTGGIGHTVLLGADLANQSSDAARRNALFAATTGGTSPGLTLPLATGFAFPAITWTGPVSRSHSLVESRSLYIQDQVELAPWLQLIAGLRYERFSIRADNLITAVPSARIDRTWSPRFGLVLKPRPDISLYASYSRSFLPQSGDQFASLDASYQSLAPEAFRNLELGVKWDLPAGLSLSLAAFQLDRSNTRVADPANPGYWILTGSSRVRGLEGALVGRIARGWQLSLGYTLQQGEIRSATSAAPAGRQLDKLPRHQVSLWTRHDVTGRLGLGLGVVHQSGQFATISNAVWLPGFTRIDAAAYFTVTSRFALQLNVENLADTRYFASAHTDNNIQPGEPLNAKLTARMTF